MAYAIEFHNQAKPILTLARDANFNANCKRIHKFHVASLNFRNVDISLINLECLEYSHFLFFFLA